MAETPTLFVCHGDDGGPRIHPCRRVQEALRAAGIEYDKVIAAHGNPIPFLRKGSRDELRAATGDTKLPALKLPDGTVLIHSRAIKSWIWAMSARLAMMVMELLSVSGSITGRSASPREEKTASTLEVTSKAFAFLSQTNCTSLSERSGAWSRVGRSCSTILK